MAWMIRLKGMKEVCEDALCGGGLGIVKGVFGISFYTSAEVEEIASLKKLALSVLQKSPELATDPLICEAIQKGQKSGLDAFAKKVPPEAVAAGVVTAAELVCTKSFKIRFADVLMGACMNLVGC
jgi:hypothetical protein